MVEDFIIPALVEKSAACCRSINRLMDEGWCNDLLLVEDLISDNIDKTEDSEDADTMEAHKEVLKDLLSSVRELRKLLKPLTRVSQSVDNYIKYRNIIDIGTIPAQSTWYRNSKWLIFEDQENSKTLIFNEWEKNFELIEN